MPERILVVVSRQDDAYGVVDLLTQLFSGEMVEFVRKSKDTRVKLANGNLVVVWSVEKWWEGTARGAMFDHIFYLTFPPAFVKRSLELCKREPKNA